MASWETFRGILMKMTSIPASLSSLFLQQNHRLDNKEKITWKLAIFTLCVFFLLTPLEEHVKIDVTQHEKKDSLHSL